MATAIRLLFVLMFAIVVGAVVLLHQRQIELFGKTERLEHMISDLRADLRAVVENAEDHDYRIAVIEPIVKLAVEEN